MKSFATICALTVGASALEIRSQKGTKAMNINNWSADVQSMPQGDGQDHTLWSWGQLESESVQEKEEEGEKVGLAADDIKATKDKLDNFWRGITSTEASHQLQCKLYREEEINLYYQCTQNAFNNYSLDHFGGDERSYPRWLSEVYRCNV